MAKSRSQAGQGQRAPKTLRKVLRKATEDDLAKEDKNREREAEAFTIAQDMITERELPMKLIRVEYSFDASRATFFFFSETRIDFRDLVKDLAYKLKSRIEMRQIGRAGRGPDDRRVRPLRPRTLLLLVPEELRTGLDPHGQEAGNGAEPREDLGRLRQAALLPLL